LEVDAHIVTGSRTAMSNLVQCVATNGIDVDELVLEPLASNKAVLTPDERKMGVAVVDIGGGTTDIAVFIDDA
ncbi:MAG: cell division protein FtsA, partial [Caldilineaceae bacterium]|nr:cell division protein FtsA [Caldilineaceae bacterium]